MKETPKCSHCYQNGHYARTCPLRVRHELAYTKGNGKTMYKRIVDGKPDGHDYELLLNGTYRKARPTTDAGRAAQPGAKSKNAPNGTPPATCKPDPKPPYNRDNMPDADPSPQQMRQLESR